jgi:2-C-methyl-D-erythritol 4-phosphate cytidylyltransferase
MAQPANGAQQVIAVILCAGQGTRMGAAQNKVFLPLAGKPLLLHTIEAFQRARSVNGIVLVAHPREVDYCRDEIVARYHLDHLANVLAVVAGGATRHQSEECALSYLRPRIEGGEVGIVLFHDGARPFVTPDEIERLIQAARESGGALLGTRVETHEVIARLGADGAVSDILPSGDLWRAQTPQAFAALTLLEAYDLARGDGFEGTDTASSYERLGHAVRMVEGSRDNIKVTTPDDLLRGEAILRQRQRDQ